MPNRKKPNTLFLPARIKRLMQKDEEVGKLSATVPVIAARALEQFLQELITKTASITTSLQAKTLTPEHIRQHIYADQRLSFLQEMANRMATGPNNPSRSLSITSGSSTPISSSRPVFQTQLSVPYQDPMPISPSTTPTNTTNLLCINQDFSRSYSNTLCAKIKSNKRTLDVVDDDDDNIDDDDDDEADEDDEDRNTRNNHHLGSLITNQRVT